MEHLHNYTYRQLWWLRFVVSIAVFLGVGVSGAMNVIDAPPKLAAQIVSAIPPIFVWACIELIARIPGIGKWFTRGRIAGAAIVALGMGLLSYSHQREAIVDLGFDEWESWIWPATVDGFMIVCSMSLVSLVILMRAKKIADEPATQRRKVADAGLADTPGALAFRVASAQSFAQAPAVVRQTALNGAKPAIAAVNSEGEQEA